MAKAYHFVPVYRYYNLFVWFLVVPGLTENVEMLHCCSERASYWAAWAPGGTFALCSWIQEHGISRNNLKPSSPHPGPGVNTGVVQLIRSYSWDRSPRSPFLGALGTFLPLLLFWSYFRRGEESGRNSPNPYWWQIGSWNPRSPIHEEPHSQTFLEQVRTRTRW